jgi:hypothetical protein
MQGGIMLSAVIVVLVVFGLAALIALTVGAGTVAAGFGSIAAGAFGMRWGLGR